MSEREKTSWLDKLILPLRRTRIVWRLVALYAVICVLPVLLFGGLYRARYTEELRAKMGADAVRLLSMLTDRQNDLLENMERITMKLSTSEPVQALLRNETDDGYARNQLAQKISELIEQNLLISPLAKNMTLLDLDGTVLYSMGYDKLQSSETMAKLVARCEQTYPLELVTTVPGSASDKTGMLMVRAINQADFTGHRLGYLILAVDEERFAEQTYRGIYPPEEGQIVLLGDDGVVVSSGDPALPSGFAAPAGTLAAVQAQYAAGTPSLELTLGAERYFTSVTYNSKARWYALALVKNSYLTAEMDKLNFFILMVSFLCLGLGLVALLVISASIVRPAGRLVRYCRGVSARTGARAIADDGQDEIGYLTREICQMVNQLDTYSRREVENSIEMKNLEIQMLQAQINPHFLFNTLNSIKWIAVLSRVPAVADSLSALSGLLKNTIVNKNEFLPLREEIENIKNYARIQSLRYTERFRMEYAVAEECWETPILKFLLQPIVENSILYGVEGVDRMVVIRVTAQAWQGGLRVSIADDGAGFDAKALAAGNPSNRRFSGIGMPNVRERIRLVYGPKARMIVTSEVGQGTTVVLELPQRSEEAQGCIS